MTADLVATLETPLPVSLPAGTGTAVFLYGTCFHRTVRLAELEILVDGVPHRPLASGMPRPDVFRALQADGSFRSGFWAIVPVVARQGRDEVELAVAARLGDGARTVAPLAAIRVTEPESPPALAGTAPDGLIAICMATFEPDLDLFRSQVESLRAQTDERWVCVVSDDASDPQQFDALLRVIGDDPRFVVSRSDERLGFYRNFERALRLAPVEAELIALCDQDDRWRPEKLAVLRGALGCAQLVYSDQRLVDAEGNVLRDTLWARRRNNHTDLISLLVANTITGAASLFRREVADLALPFPDSPGLPFHDHWIGLVALAAGDVAYVDRPLYDYVQHRGAFFGAVTHGTRPRRAARLRGGRGAYFRGYLARGVLARVLVARCGARLTPRKRRALERFGAAERSPLAFAWLAVRPLRVVVGRTETLGSESELLPGIVWRRLLPVLALGARRPGRRPLDASMPGMLSFEQRRLRRWRADV